MRPYEVTVLAVISVLLGYKVSAKPYRKHAIEVSCEFAGETTETSHCWAEATLCPRFIIPRTSLELSQNSNGCADSLHVNCNGSTIYKGEFLLRYDSPRDVLQGIVSAQNPIAPSVVISPPTGTERIPHLSKAILNLGNDAEISGGCRILE